MRLQQLFTELNIRLNSDPGFSGYGCTSHLGLVYANIDTTTATDPSTDEATEEGQMVGEQAPSTAVRETLLSTADTALWRAVAESPNGTALIVIDDEQKRDLVRPASVWRYTLAEIISSGSLLLYYQPLYAISRRQTMSDISGATNIDVPLRLLANEVYARAELPEGVVAAAEFIPMAERFGLLPALDKTIISKALAVATDAGPLVMNLSTQALRDPKFVAWLRDTVAKTPSSECIFEIDERAIKHAPAGLAHLMSEAGRFGYQFSIDHFGSGATSFAYLSQLEISMVKLDRSYVTGIAERPDHQFFIESTLQICHARDILVTTEGFEQQADLDCLQRLGVDCGIGHLLGRPGPLPVR